MHLHASVALQLVLPAAITASQSAVSLLHAFVNSSTVVLLPETLEHSTAVSVIPVNVAFTFSVLLSASTTMSSTHTYAPPYCSSVFSHVLPLPQVQVALSPLQVSFPVSRVLFELILHTRLHVLLPDSVEAA